MNLDHIDEEIIESSKETMNPKGRNSKKERKKCNLCNEGFHPDISCMVKTIDLMAKVLQKNNLMGCIPDSMIIS